MCRHCIYKQVEKRQAPTIRETIDSYKFYKTWRHRREEGRAVKGFEQTYEIRN